jgi:hypothetical protein
MAMGGAKVRRVLLLIQVGRISSDNLFHLSCQAHRGQEGNNRIQKYPVGLWGRLIQMLPTMVLGLVLKHCQMKMTIWQTENLSLVELNTRFIQAVFALWQRNDSVY